MCHAYMYMYMYIKGQKDNFIANPFNSESSNPIIAYVHVLVYVYVYVYVHEILVNKTKDIIGTCR